MFQSCFMKPQSIKMETYQSCTYLWQMTLKLTIKLKRLGGSKYTIHVTKAFEQIAMCMQHVLVMYM